MTIDRAIEILNPEHRECYDGMDEVNEACRMGMEALKRTRWMPCRDCVHIYIDGYGYLICVKSGLYSDENDYCSRGQRRDQSADARNLDGGDRDGK